MKTVLSNSSPFQIKKNVRSTPRKAAVPFIVLILLLLSFTHSPTRETAFTAPTLYDEETIARASEIRELGYNLLDSGDLDGAIAKFEEMSGLMDFPITVQYHTACAYASAGETDKAFEYIERMLDGGLDVSRWLKGDQRFEALRKDPRFDGLIERADENYETGTAALANGMPDYEKAPVTFTTEDEFNAWIGEQSNLLGKNEGWHRGAPLLAARIDFLARALAAERELKAGDPSYDYALERIRAPFTTRLMPSFSPGWGSVSDMILHEIDTYLGSSPQDEGLSEACYYAGRALSMKYPAGDMRVLEAFTKARTYLDKAVPGTEFYAAAQALLSINDLKTPFADQEKLRRRLRDLVERHPGDARLYRAVSTGLNHNAAGFLWPIHIDTSDIDGKTVALDQYKGKVLLIDFWATWCMPCRKEIPNLVEALKEYHNRGFEILSVCLDKSDRLTSEAFRKVAGENGMKWRHIYDGRAFESDLVRRFFVGTIPAPFLVGPDGSLVAWGKDCRGEKLARNVEKALESRGN